MCQVCYMGWKVGACGEEESRYTVKLMCLAVKWAMRGEEMAFY